MIIRVPRSPCVAPELLGPQITPKILAEIACTHVNGGCRRADLQRRTTDLNAPSMTRFDLPKQKVSLE